MLSCRISATAEADIEAILDYSLDLHGEDAAIRYAKLLEVSIASLCNDPSQSGVNLTLDELSKFHISMCKKESHVDGIIVSDPRHLIFFRVADSTLEVVRVLHESMDFERHL
jgi:toxin ParE1/3/4